MAAIIHLPTSRSQESQSRELSEFPVDLPSEPTRRALRVVEGGRSVDGRRRRMVYLRRRVGLALGVTVFVAAAWVSFTAPTSSPASSAASVPAVSGAEYVVRSGDTLWTIAQALEPGGDLRDAVATLADANGGAVLVPGQVVVIPPELRQD